MVLEGFLIYRRLSALATVIQKGFEPPPTTKNLSKFEAASTRERNQERSDCTQEG